MLKILVFMLFSIYASVNAKNTRKEIKNINNKENKEIVKNNELDNEKSLKKADNEKKEKKQKENIVLDLKSALGLALAKNETVEMAKLRVGMAQNSVYSTYAGFMPTIGANLGYSFTARDGYNSILETPYGNIVRNLNTSNDFSGSISASMNLISFGRDYYKLKISKHNKKISEYDLDLNEEQLILNVLAAYYSLLSSYEKEKVMVDMLNLYKSTMDAARLKYKLGMVALVDKLSAENSYSESSIKNKEAKVNTKKVQAELSVLIGFEPDAEFDVEHISQIPDKINLDIEELKKTALNNRSDLKKLRETKKALEYELKALKTSRYPTVDLNASTGTQKNLDKSNTDFINNSSVSVGMTIPIFSGLSITNSIRSKEKEIKSYELQINATKKAIEKEVVSSYYDFLINQEKFFITKELLKTATENAKVTLGMYKNGKISILELLNVHSKLEEAKLNYVESKYSWFTYRAKLLNAIGKLDLNNVINIGEF